MPLVVAALRLSMVLLNVYETFKTLKTPRPSARNGGRPSIRAMSQRKRDMKGCLAIWIVWFCYAFYERMLDGIVRLLVPFYDELKCILLLFLILTRARGAEPIYLHVVRPLIKPYGSTIDGLLDLTGMFGDILVILAGYPFRLAVTWWQTSDFVALWHAYAEVAQTDEDTTPNRVVIPSQSQPTLTSASQQSLNMLPRASGQPVNDRPASSASVASRASQNERAATRPPRPVSANGVNAGAVTSHQIWYPPISSYDEDGGLAQVSASDERPISLPITPPTTADQVSRVGTPEKTVEEWRLYPPFPSAYPPTPLPVSSVLPRAGPSRVAAPQPSRPSDIVQFPIVEEAEHDSDSHAEEDADKMEVDKGDDSDEEVDEDMDVTLRTPHPNRTRKISDTTAASIESTSSAPSRSTALTTAGDASSLRTRSSSEESSSSESSSSSSSIVGRKRVRPGTNATPRQGQGNGYERIWSGNTVIGVRPSPNAPSRTRGTDSSTDSTGTTDDSTDTTESSTTDSEVADERVVPGIKRRRVGHPLDANLARPNRIKPVGERRANGQPSAATTSRNHIPLRASARLASSSSLANVRAPAPSRPTTAPLAAAPRPPSAIPRNKSTSGRK